MPASFIVIFIGLLVSAQPVTTDLSLASFPAMAEDFAADVLQIQLTLSSLLLAFGISQLFLGPISDRFGRRPVLLWGIGLYTACSFLASMAQGPQMLIAFRALQGMGLSAAVMCARAMVRDVYAPHKGALALNSAFTILGIAAMSCAIMGALIAQYLSWRMAFVTMGLYGLGLLYITHRYFQETLLEPNPHALRPRVIARQWGMLLTHKGFWTYASVSILTYLTLFSFLACSSFVLIEYHGMSKLQYGLALFFQPIFYIVGTSYCRRLLGRMSLQAATHRGTWVLLLAGSLLLALDYAARFWPLLEHPICLLIPFYIFMIGHGVMQSCGQTGVVSHFPKAAGAAAAMNGALMMFSVFGLTLWLGTNLQSDHTTLTHAMGVLSLILAVVTGWIVPRYGQLPKH